GSAEADLDRDRLQGALGGGRLSPRDQHRGDSRGGIRMKVVGGRLANVEPLDPQKGKSHYFLGNDPAKWRRNVPHYGRVQVKDVYPGVDLVLHGENGRVEYDFVVAPGYDHGRVELEFAGMQDLRMSAEGDLVLKTPRGEIRHLKPHVHQEQA